MRLEREVQRHRHHTAAIVQMSIVGASAPADRHDGIAARAQLRRCKLRRRCARACLAATSIVDNVERIDLLEDALIHIECLHINEAQVQDGCVVR